MRTFFIQHAVITKADGTIKVGKAASVDKSGEPLPAEKTENREKKDKRTA